MQDFLKMYIARLLLMIAYKYKRIILKREWL